MCPGPKFEPGQGDLSILVKTRRTPDIVDAWGRRASKRKEMVSENDFPGKADQEAGVQHPILGERS